MTRKDYVKAAAIIREAFHGTLTEHGNSGKAYANGRNDAAEMIAARMADWFAADNPNFDRARFMAACGLEE